MLILAACCGLLSVALGVWYAGESIAGAVDATIRTVVTRTLAGEERLLELLVLPSHAIVLVAITLVAGVVCVAQRRRRELPLLFVPWLAVAFSTWLLKPAFGRTHDGGLAYPSGHTVSLVAVLAVLAVLARPGVATQLVVAVGVVLTSAAGIGMVAYGYHYATDVLGGALFAVAAVLASAEALGVFSAARRRRRREPARSSG